jgi:hypothetical protein
MAIDQKRTFGTTECHIRVNAEVQALDGSVPYVATASVDGEAVTDTHPVQRIRKTEAEALESMRSYLEERYGQYTG